LAGAASVLTLVLASCGGSSSGGDGGSSVTTVSVPTGQVVAVDQLKYLTAVATDSEGRTLSVSADRFTWQVLTGGTNLTFQTDGRARGLAEGTATVAASYGGVTSAAATITVVPPLAGCSATSYTPNYYNAIATPGTPNVSGNFRFWAKTPLRIRYVRDANWTQALEDRFKEGIADWQASTSNGIEILETTDSSLDDIEVSFVPGDSLPGNAIGITYATFDSTSREMVAAQIQVANDLATPSISRSTCSHELGHALGIGGHSPADTDLMFYAENGTSRPTASDLNTLRTVYCDVFPRSRSRSPRNLVTEAIICER
jgi:hypothetical protein